MPEVDNENSLTIGEILDRQTVDRIVRTEAERLKRGQTRSDPLSMAIKMFVGVTPEAEDSMRVRDAEKGTDCILTLNTFLGLTCEISHRMRGEIMEIMQRYSSELGTEQPLAELLGACAMQEILSGLTGE